MSRPVHPDCLAGTLDDEDDGHEREVSGSADYGSLLGAGRGLRKKRPCLVLDPEEAENAARLVQHVAAQQLSGDEPPPLPDIYRLAKPPAADAGHGAEAPASVPDLPSLEWAIQATLAAVPAEPTEPEAGETERAADLVAPPEPPRATVVPAQRRPGHSLRRRLPARRASTTLAFRLRPLVRRLRRWWQAR